MSDARVTLVVPAYDQSEAYVRAALESVRAQTLDAWTCVLLDDRPTASDYRRVVESYADPRIRYVRNTGPHGIGAAWNAGLELARTPFATLLHADDVLEPRYVAAMLALADRCPHAAAYACEPTMIDAAGVARRMPRDVVRDAIMAVVRPSGDPYAVAGWTGIARLTLANFIICPGTLYRLDALPRRPFSERLRFVLDLEFNIETLLRGGRIAGTTQRLIRYRRHAAQATAVLGRDDLGFLEEIGYLRALRGRLRGTPFARAAPFARLSPFVRLNLAIAAIGDFAALRVASGARRLARLARSFA